MASDEAGAREQFPVELILLRQVASSLAMPIFIVDISGNLLFYNEPAEQMLGHRYDETGEMPLEEWSTMFLPTDAAGSPLPADDLPLVKAIRDRLPAHGGFWITGMDGRRRQLSVTALPLIGMADRHLGSMAIFWEAEG
ncbi:MAG TPA: PAS domain-containing protein [Actinomycetota bacterium]|nr:PAS domain-containing protein [Actinomycetota bacterium]